MSITLIDQNLTGNKNLSHLTSLPKYFICYNCTFVECLFGKVFIYKEQRRIWDTLKHLWYIQLLVKIEAAVH